jgi:transposase InsO family protein
MAASYKTPPAFNSGTKPYSRWVEEVKAWKSLTDLDKKKQGLAIALSLEETDPSGIRDKVFSDLEIAKLETDDGVAELLKFMDKIFKKDDLSEAYEVYTDFDRFRRDEKMTMDMYVMEFEKRYNKTKKFKMDLPQSVLCFKLLEGANLANKDRQLVLTGVDYAKDTTLFTQMGTSLRKFFGQQAVAGSSMDTHSSVPNIKLEPSTFMAEEDQEAYANRGYWQRNFRGGRYNKGRGQYYGANDYKYRGAGQGKPKSDGGYKQGFKSSQDGPNHVKKLNPLGPEGSPLRCKSCDSIRHLLADCPDSYENMRKAETSEPKPEKAALFTGNVESEMQALTSETMQSAVLDSACSSTVAGEAWMQCYLDSLDPQEFEQVVRTDSDTVFKFGGGSRLKSKEKVTFPCKIAGTNCEITTDVVESDIPLLLSKTAMKKAKVKLDLENDSAEIFGRDVDLHCTSSGHYCVTLEQQDIPVAETFQSLVEPVRDSAEKRKIVDKLHKQFAHPTEQRLKALIKDAGVRDEEYLTLIDEVSKNCQICKKYKRTPARPVVSLPLATEFNEAVAMDLKKWKDGVYLLHLIDMATRFSLACVIHDKTPATITNQVMTKWVGSGLGTPKKFLADNGGEFANEEYKDMCENLNVECLHTAAYSPWQNGLCERNHAVVDDCVSKILEDNPNMSLEVAITWAINSKNSLQMVHGWSPYQLVFGTNPNLPSVLVDKPPALQGTTVSENVAQHLNAMHSGRRAFIEAESSERIRRALRHQIRASGEPFQLGDHVYYKRDDSNKWKGPGKVIGQDGKVVFVRHGSVYVRVHPCRLVRVGEEFVKDAEKEVSGETTSSRSEVVTSHDEQISDDETVESVGEMLDPVHVDVQPVASGSVPSVRVTEKKDLPQNNDNIVYRTYGSDTWIKSVVLHRGGKSTGQNWAYLNVHDSGEELPKGIDFVKDVEEWKLVDETGSAEVNVVKADPCRTAESEIDTAKQKELLNWKTFGVYEDIVDEGQVTVSTRWVLTEKEVEGTSTTKARLVARGFEEDPIQSDSPTANKDTLRIFFAITSSMGWPCQCIDIKAAFLQGKEISREVYLKPPAEANAGRHVIWKLKKCVYGLNDASRNWYFSVREELLKNECVQSSIDPALFYWYHEDKLAGLFIMHVDDFLWSGTSAFKEKVVDRIRETYVSGKEAEDSFKYIGLEIEHHENGITVHQNPYIDELRNITVTPARLARKTDELNKEETKRLRETIGQANWVATQSRPDLSYDVLELSVAMKQPKVEHISQANKMVRKMKCDRCKVVFPRLGNVNNIRIAMYSDASYANLPDGVSSAEGHLVLIYGENGQCSPLAWCTRKIRRVVKSTIAAETLALVDGLDTAYYVGSIISELLFRKIRCNVIPIDCFIDNKSLYDNIHSTKLVHEKRLRIDIATIKEMVQKGEVSKVQWVPNSRQLSDSLTKRGANTRPLLDLFNTGQLLVE